MAKLTKPQRARLDKLATYLEKLPADYRYFEMMQWLAATTTTKARQYALKNGGVASCGTAACAAGHGPAAGVLMPDKFIRPRGRGFSIDWEGYARELFASDGRVFDWLFQGSWGFYDNHHYGAAARVRYALDRGGPPAGFSYAQAAWLPAYAPYRIDAKAPANA